MIYFVQAGDNGPVKIGYARTVPTRVQVMQSSHYEPLYVRGVLPGEPADERAMRRRFVLHLIRGEWFKPEGALLEFIAELPPLAADLRKLNRRAAWSGLRHYHCRIIRREGGYETYDMRGW